VFHFSRKRKKAARPKIGRPLQNPLRQCVAYL
jgi:hypothetical protein